MLYPLVLRRRPGLGGERPADVLGDDEQGLAELDRLTVLDEDGADRAGAGATISLKVFIASISSSLSPTSTFEPTSTNALASGEGRR